MVKVSIIVPVYNVEQYLETCLESLIHQTLKEIEIIVVNDGTKDNSAQIAEGYAAKDSRVRLYSKTNGGLSDARNYGMMFAKGEYIGFVDADDYVEIQMYELLYKKAKEENCDIVECNLFHDYPESRDIEIGEPYQTIEEMIMMGRSVVWNKIYRREWLERTGVSFPVGFIYEDVEFYEKLLIHLKKIEYIKEPLIHYVQRDSSINHETTLRTLQILEILQHIIDYYKINGEFCRYHAALEFLFARILLCSSFLRIVRIADRKQRNEALRQNWDMLNRTFPGWKKNQYLKEKRGKKILYMRLMNYTWYRLFGVLFHLTGKWKGW